MSYQAERQLLGTIIDAGITPDVSDCLESLSAKMITDPKHVKIFETIRFMSNNSLPVNIGSVLERVSATSSNDPMEAANAGDMYDYTSDLYRDGISHKAIERLTGQIKAEYSAMLSARMLQKALEQIQAEPLRFEDALSKLEANLQTLEGSESDSEPVSFGSYAMGYLDLMQARIDGKEDAIGLDIGLDTQLNRTDMALIAAPSGMGKTALSLYCAEYVARQGKPVLYFSLEMEGIQLFEREVTRGGKMAISALKDPVKYDLDYAYLNNGVVAAKDLPIFVDDSSKLNVFTFKRRARRFKAKNPGLAAIFIDYLTLMDLPSGDRRDLQLTEASRQLKLFAKEIKTPIIVLAQVNKQAGKLGREPVKEDIRDGAIENDADKIFMPWRDDVSNPNSPNKGLAKVIKAKVRDGSCEPVLMRFENGNFYEGGDLSWVDAEEQENEQRESKQRQVKYKRD